MAKSAARKQVLKKAGVTIAGVRVTGLSVDNTGINVMDNDSGGLPVFLTESGEQSLSLTISGVESDHVLRDISLDPAVSQLLTDLSFVFSDSLAAKDTITGNFYMTNYKEDGDHKDAVQFSASFSSSGTWTRS